MGYSISNLDLDLDQQRREGDGYQHPHRGLLETRPKVNQTLRVSDRLTPHEKSELKL